MNKFTKNSACDQLAYLYCYGGKIETNIETSLAWIRTSGISEKNVEIYCYALSKRGKIEDLDEIFNLLNKYPNINNIQIITNLLNACIKSKNTFFNKNFEKLIPESNENLLCLFLELCIIKGGDERQTSINKLIEMSKNNVDACMTLARMYNRGKYVKYDSTLSKEYYNIAIKKGSLTARNELFDILYESKNDKELHEAYKLVCESHTGDCYGQARLAKLYYKGRSVEKNLDKAIEILSSPKVFDIAWTHQFLIDALLERNKKDDSKKAFEYLQNSDLNDPELAGRIARLYRNGKGTKKDITTSLKYYSISACKNISWARNEYFDLASSSGDTNHLKTALKLIKSASESGDGYAMGRLGRAYRDGTGVEIDVNTAIEWMNKSMNKKVPWATNEYINLLLKRGLENDLKNAYELCIKFSKEGNKETMVTLGLMYRDGIYVNKDLNESIKWFTLAEQ